MKIYQKPRVLVILSISFFLGIALFQNATVKNYTDLAPVQRINVQLDDGSFITVDNASHMPDTIVKNIVLAADRSTKTGCPYRGQQKGLMRGGTDGDRVFVSDYYLAWFDYTVDDSPGTGSKWARSGGLAGYWSLNPNTSNFRYFFSSYSPAAELPNANGICWNWSKNELIVGSNSPQGQSYFWDKFAPPLENTIVFKTSPTQINVFSTVYPQGVSASHFTRGNEGMQNAVGVHYTTAGFLTSWKGDTSFTAVDPKTFGNPVQGQINYVLDYVCKEKEIQVVWVYKSTVDVKPENSYIDLWVSYSGLNVSAACGAPGSAVPPQVFGAPTTGVFNSNFYNYVNSSLDYFLIDKTGKKVNYKQNIASPFPWDQAQPCNGKVNVGLMTNKLLVNTIPQGIPLGASVSLAATSLFASRPNLMLVNRMTPNLGDGSYAHPIGFPYLQLGVNYENSDQQQGLLMLNSDRATQLDREKWYITSYSLLSVF